MSFVYFTDEVIENFGGSGMDPLFEVLESYQESDAESEETLAVLFTEMLLLVDEGQLDVNDVKKFLSQAIKSDDHARIFFQVLNSFAISRNLRDLIHLLFRDNKIKPETLALHLHSDFIKEVDIVQKDFLSRPISHSVRDTYLTQKKFNLLHEEVEGYSKFITEMYTIFREPDTDFKIDYALQVVDKLIGHYDLDPNRCLDVLIEVFAVIVVSQHRNILRFLRKSRWWPEVESDCSSISTLSVGGSDTAAKVIGLKILSGCTKDWESYKTLFAILIKEGFVSFGSIFKYLSPNDEEMQKLEEEHKKKLDRDVLIAGANALALAAPLADDEEESSDGKTKKKSSSGPEPEKNTISSMLGTNTKYQFLKTFLAFGLYWPSIFILTKYPFLAQIDDVIPVLVNRLFAGIIDPLYKGERIFTEDEVDSMHECRAVAYSRPHNSVNVEPASLVYYFTFRAPYNDFAGKRFKFCYQEWTEQLPKVTDIDSLIQVSKELLAFNGPYLAKSVIIFNKLCQVVQNLMAKGEDKSKIYSYFRNFIFPAMPLIEENSIAIDNAYEILGAFPIEDRFSLYGELYLVLAKNNPLIKIAYSKAEKSTKDVLKRLSKENVRPMMRRLAKISVSNPLPCLLTILQQIESYDNLNTLVVETARYFNAYGWDNLTAAILMRLASSRSSTYNGMSERQWAQSLASFIGKICQRYPRAIDIKTILLYILKSFHSGETIGLLVLKEMFISMGGIQTITNLTLNQIDLINCGSSLQKIVHNTIDDLRFERQATGRYLIKCLSDLDAVNELLVLLCRISSQLTFTGDEEYLKVLVSKSDDLNSVIRMFVTLISLYGDDLKLMSVKELNDLGVPLPWAFEVWRAKGDIQLDQLPAEIHNTLFDNFWKLSLHDINYSDELYDQETLKLQSNIKSLTDSIALNVKNKEVSRSTIDKQRDELDASKSYEDSLPKERESHKEDNEVINKKLEEVSGEWFENLKIEDFILQCVFQRNATSSFDAVYSARFIFKLHSIKTKNYSLINVLDLLFKSRILFGTLFTSTPTEAENIGLFFADILKTLQGWTDEKKYAEVELKDQEGDTVTFDDFRNLLFEYHSIILEEVKIGLQVTEYISRNNTITFLKNLLGVYPTVVEHCEIVVKLIEHLALTEERNDLKLASNALLVHIKSRSKEWVPTWDFIAMSEEDKQKLVDAKERTKRRAALRLAREKQAKLEKLKEERLAKEEQVRLARAEEEDRKKKLLVTTAVNYDSGTGGARTVSRGSTIERSSYEKYAQESKPEAPKKEVEEKKQTPEATPHPQSEKELPPGAAGKGSLQSKISEMKKAYKEQKASESRAKTEKKNEEPKGTKPEEKSEEKDKEPVTRDETSKEKPTNGTPEEPPVRKRTPLPPQREVLRSGGRDMSSGNSESKRAPLPPQQEIKGRSSSSTSSRPPLPPQERVVRGGVQQSRADSRSPRSGAPPLPPPPPPPPPLLQRRGGSGRSDSFGRDHDRPGRTPTFDNRQRDSGGGGRDGRDRRDHRDGNGRRSDNKRRGDGFGGRGYDKRSRY
ncbi:THO complex subunit 2 [Candida viswanathii]|uniref:THO complex subunit 2 n=1 Tax=Candida viswanathii TaxID=5486 RepID=A0A367XL12_9ASCO|nr:THO complex subunit 2 [Candida viswanathii]